MSSRRNIALRLAYDGTDFHGSQWQPSRRTIQGVVESAWTTLTQERHRCTLAGRTDAGVHAHGQVANMQTTTQYPVATIQRALNALLPNDVRVLDVWDAEPNFHARFSARWRSYRYLINSGPVEHPHLRRYVVHIRSILNVAAMHEALIPLHGQHDFSAFTKVVQPSSTERTCYQASCHTIDWFEQSLIAIDLVANAFLRNMVRVIVGTLVLVGREQITPKEFEEIFRSQNRTRAGATAPAHGLTLLAVGYSEGRP